MAPDQTFPDWLPAVQRIATKLSAGPLSLHSVRSGSATNLAAAAVRYHKKAKTWADPGSATTKNQKFEPTQRSDLA